MLDKKHIFPLIALIFTCQILTGKNFNDDNMGPTMGWSSWNTYGIHISDSLIMSQADAMAKSGLKDAGYKYIDIDDGYFGGRDQQTGELLIHPTRFPRGMKRVVDYIHSLGLKAGIYSDAGQNTCGNYWNKDTIARGVGLLGHEYQDAELFFNKLGFDFIKVDYCGAASWYNTPRLSYDTQERYTAIKEAIDATGRKDVRLNVCRWRYPGTWISDVASSWRISGDISCRWSSVKSIIAESLYMSAYAFDGHFNDMDMLEVGRTLSQTEDETHFAMWCILASPLLIGCDLTSLKPETLELLTNPELIEVNQDRLYQQAHVVRHDGETYVLVKDLYQREGNTRVVALYNPSEENAVIEVRMDELYLGGRVKVRDIVRRTDMKDVKDGILSCEVPAHGCKIMKLTSKTRLERTLYEAETAFLTSYQELYDESFVGSAFYLPREDASGRMIVCNLGVRPNNDIQWRNVNSHGGGRYKFTVRCFSEKKTQFYFAVNGSPGQKAMIEDGGEYVDVSFEYSLADGDNVIRLYNDQGRMPDIDYMIVTRID